MGTSKKVNNGSVGVVHLPSAYDNSSFLGKLLYMWAWSFLYKFTKKPLRLEDLYQCPKSVMSSTLGEQLEQYWEEHLKICEKTKRKPSLFWPIIRMNGTFYLFISIFCILGYLMQILQTVFMGCLIEYVELLSNESLDKQQTTYKIQLCGIGIVVTQALYIFFINPYFFYASKVGMNIRVACCSLIYRKSLKLNKNAFLFTTTGQMVNLLSNDTSKFDLMPVHTPFFFYGPLVTVLSIYFLWDYLQYTTIYGILILFLYIPLQVFMGKAFSKLRAKAAILTDQRVRLMNEFIPAMRVIKMYTWEKPFAKIIDDVRKQEIIKIRLSSYLRAINISLFYVAAKIIVFVIFIIWLSQGNYLSALTVFLTMGYMNQVRFAITLMMPNSVSFGAEGLISIRRITAFLCLPERQDSTRLNRSNFIFKGNDAEVKICDLVVSYGEYVDSKQFAILNNTSSPKNQNNEIKVRLNVLENINLNCKPGELNVIVGPVGSGKTSFLLSILGELFIKSGKININGRISYASQEAWTFAGTVRENIIFNSIYDENKYNNVITACALARDFSLFPNGDQTIIGDRGVALSGGQKSRINLARCLYLDADIYLLDDPLSAVDPHVAEHIFFQAIRGYLAEKVVILVTHQLQFIKNANKILLIKHGKQIAYGDYTTLLGSLNNKIEFSEFIGISFEQNKNDPKKVNKSLSISSEISFTESLGSNHSLSPTQMDIELELEHKNSIKKRKLSSNENLFKISIKNKNQEKNNCNQHRIHQERITSSASLKAYLIYIKLGSSYWLGPALIISFCISQLLFSGTDYWLALWTDSQDKNFKNFANNTIKKTSFVDKFTLQENIFIYVIQMILLFVFSFLRGIMFFMFCMRSSVRLHDRLFQKIVHAPISFFDNNPIGILLNKCSRDIGIIDDLLPQTAFDAVGIIVTDIGIAILLIYLNYYLVFPLMLLIFLIYFIHKYYVSTARKIKILEGVAKSPVCTALSTSLYGLTTIRAFNVQKRFENRFDTLQNDQSAAFFTSIFLTRWFLFHLDLCSIFFVSGITFVVVLYAEMFSPSFIGLVIVSTLNFTSGFQWCIRQWAELETQMTCVDRVNDYNYLEQEPLLDTDPNVKIDEKWPQNGRIEFKNVTMRYFKDEKPVLNDLNFIIESKQKVGIVGRTGAGKSSIIAALFRMTECEGELIIDGIDCKKIGLHRLRKNLAIIPQEPVLFTGTVRSNLDPFNENSDDQLWKTLKEIQLDETVKNMEGGLDSAISDGGCNFSVGQKQLICLARAILRNNRILILDEATANCDPHTDELIQKTIRTVFSECTIITIAHRLNTIIDSDKILVLDAGGLKEYASPYELILEKNSIFNSMINATGKETARNLRKIAKEVHLLKSIGATYNELKEKLHESSLKLNETNLDDNSFNQLKEDKTSTDQKREWTHF